MNGAHLLDFGLHNCWTLICVFTSRTAPGKLICATYKTGASLQSRITSLFGLPAKHTITACHHPTTCRQTHLTYGLSAERSAKRSTERFLEDPLKDRPKDLFFAGGGFAAGFFAVTPGPD